MNQSSLFFIDKKRNEYSFNEFPEALYIDTSFWIEYFGGNGSEYSRDCRNFLQDCLDNEVILVTSNRVKGELEFNIKKAMVTKFIEEKKIEPHKIVRVNGGSINYKETFKNIIADENNYKELCRLIEKDINYVSQLCVDAEYKSDIEFWNKTKKIKEQTRYVIEDKDAEHVAIAIENGINSIATKDGDYFALDGMNIFTLPTDRNIKESFGRANILKEFNENLFEESGQAK